MFMKREIIGPEKWLKGDAMDGGTQFVQASMFSKSQFAKELGYKRPDLFCGEIGDFERIEEVYGYGARLSAPGYLDCTDWVVFPSEEEANDYLLDLDDEY